MIAPVPPRPSSLLKRVLDAFSGSTLKPPAATPFREMGMSGTGVFGGYVQSRERSSQWVGAQRYVTISDMAVNASIVAAGMHYFLNLIAHPRWAYRPPEKLKDDAEAQAAADLVAEVMDDLGQPWSRVVRRAGTYRFYGFGVQEWTAKKRTDGKIGLASIEPRPQATIERWSVDESGAVSGVWQRPPQTGELLGIPRSKILYLVDDVLSDSPEGVGIFRHLAEPWERLKTYYALEARAFERDLRGTPVGRVPYTLLREAVASGELTEDQAKALTETMERFVKLQVKQSDTAITLDSIPYYSQASDGNKVAGIPQWGLELLQGGSAGMGEVAAAITRTQTEMARIIACEGLMMGEQSGNRSLGEDKSRNLYLIGNAVLSDIVGGVRQDIISAICDLNGIPEEMRPVPEAEDIAFKSAETVARILAQMAQAGAVLAPDDPVVEDVRSLMGVSPPPPPSPEMMGVAAGPKTPSPSGDAAPSEDGGVPAEDLGDGGAEGGGSGGVQKGQDAPLTPEERQRLADRFVEDGDGLIFKGELEKSNPNHDELGRFAEGPGGGGGGGGGGSGGGDSSDPSKEFRTKSKGTDDALNSRIVKESGAKLIVSTALLRDATEALAHVVADSKSNAALLKKMTIEFKDMPGRHGTQTDKTLYISSKSLQEHGPGFAAAIIRHELEHKRLSDEKVPSNQQEPRVRRTAGMWAATRYSTMANTNPRAAHGFRLAAREQGIKV